jgi:hypothetical protein
VTLLTAADLLRRYRLRFRWWPCEQASTEAKAWEKAHDMRGYDLLAGAGDMGRHGIPIAREQVAKRDQATTGAGTGAV